MRATPQLAALALLLAIAALPAWADQKPDGRRLELDRLYEMLKTAPTEQAASGIENRIRELWLKLGSPAAALLIARGDRDLQGNLGGEALADYDAALTLEPNYAEGFNRRAMARASLGDYAGAVADIGEALKREPNHFSALQGLSRIAEDHGDWKGALAAWQKALEIDPHAPGGAARLEMLQKKAFGQET